MLRFLHLFLLVNLFCVSGLFAQETEQSIDTAIELFNKGNHEKAQKILTDKLVKDPEDVESRVVLGVMALNLGKDDRALDVWETGLKKSGEDFPLLINIAKVHLERATNSKKTKPRFKSQQTDDSQENNNKNTEEHLDKALKNYIEASSFYPHQAGPLEELAAIYTLKKEYDSTLIYWNRLREMFSEQEKYWVETGNTYVLMDSMKIALDFFDKAIEINPSFGLAYKGKASCLQSLSADSILIERAIKQAKYYDWIPDFMELTYSDSLYRQVSMIAQKKQRRKLLLPKLLKEKGLESKKLLALSLWYGSISKMTENKIFRNLTRKNNEEGLFLLVEMLQNTERKFLASKLMIELAKAKPAGTFDLLLPFLNWTHPMQPLPITKALVTLDDSRAIPYLIRELEVEQTLKAQNMKEIIYAIPHRQKVALSLSNFDSPLTVEYLQKGLKNPNIARHCAASLYRISGEEVYLKKLKKLVKKIDKDFLLADFLIEEIGDKASLKLARKLE